MVAAFQFAARQRRIMRDRKKKKREQDAILKMLKSISNGALKAAFKTLFEKDRHRESITERYFNNGFMNDNFYNYNQMKNDLFYEYELNKLMKLYEQERKAQIEADILEDIERKSKPILKEKLQEVIKELEISDRKIDINLKM